MDWIFDGMLDKLARALLAAFDALLALLTKVLLLTPDVTNLPQVKALTDRSVWVVDTVFVLAFVAAGTVCVVSGASENARYQAKDLLPRMVVGFIAAHFSPLVCSQAITLANALVAAFTGRPGTDDSPTKAMRHHLNAAITGGSGIALFLVLIGVLVVVLAAVAVFQMLVRTCALLVLATFAPIALALHATPATDGLARLWWRGFAGCLAVPVLQAFTLQAGGWMLTNPDLLLPNLGLPGEPLEVLNLMIVVVLLWTTVKIPGLVAKHTRSPAAGGRTTVGAFLKVAVMQKGLNKIPGLK
ncbi:hypothetical protein GCM10010124_25090 [Pilimelia terevasa]|uniref:TrbL/VirB6 plasmid conjugal transfer protein n=1 Tax=Pilimelia terevasa TaxID=53372 RepID=A0A8J3FL08_9ACTN|nr:conjugal transfer protein TrbL family protein [Pilimelia terevasa]GGK31307.1 hypothetical protein GCM10010124_25090 [Pilimelia terevasa]